MKKSKIAVLIITAVALCAALVLTAGASSGFMRSLEAVYRNIKIIVDGAEITPTDVNGNVVEPFIVDGTVYLPARAVAEAFGRDVEWDSDNDAVIIKAASYDPIVKPEPKDAPPAPNKNVTVSTAQELADAVAPDTCITIKAGVYDLSTVTKSDNPYVEVGSRGMALRIMDVEGLTIKAEPGAEVELITPDRFSEVLIFTDCNGVTLSGIKAGHSVTGSYECDAGVVQFAFSANITIDDCLFYGCGTIGITLQRCVTVFVSDTTVTDCSLRAVDLRSSADVIFKDCKFTDNRAYGCVITGYQSEAIFRDCLISGNKKLEWSIVEFDGDVLFDGCKFTDNALSSGAEPVFKGYKIRLKDCEIEKGNFSSYWDGVVTDLGGNKLS